MTLLVHTENYEDEHSLEEEDITARYNRGRGLISVDDYIDRMAYHHPTILNST